ncbi:hypothetical protein GTP81_08400 [Rugamonas sp. FT107W]|uniref:BcpO-related WXXGXW repeat protein n=2 Tax=Duganella TaxID=75654 RepID=A0A845HDD0_9BURK|nr:MULTISPECIES: hypothetical protein [Duganella]MYM73911.1 hypothetical protein [Duganella margarita]MYN16771.1 hypothetical protein [Duganella vulcania]
MRIVSSRSLWPCALLMLGWPSLAAQHAERGERGLHAPRVEQWHGDIRQFHRDDFSVWQGGRWLHGPHAGRDGWWWIVGLNWYWYPEPVYPFPDPYLPPPAVAIAPAVPGTMPPYWYYCANPPGYYPYVPQCAGTWERVPAAPR